MPTLFRLDSLIQRNARLKSHRASALCPRLEGLEERTLLAYTFTKIADTSSLFSGFLREPYSVPSINDQGTVAFRGLLLIVAQSWLSF